MNARTLAQRAYAGNTAPTRAPRGIEYEVIARITHRIKSAAMKGPAAFPELASALHENRQLWTLLAIDVAGPANDLPEDLRARLFYLSEFTAHHTSKVLARTASVAPLLEVNTAVLRGLRTEKKAS